MPFHKTFGIDLGTSTVKIYSQEQDTMITEKNMIAIRNQNQVLAVGNEAYGMYEKNPSNVSVISPMAFGKIGFTGFAGKEQRRRKIRQYAVSGSSF